MVPGRRMTSTPGAKQSNIIYVDFIHIHNYVLQAVEYNYWSLLVNYTGLYGYHNCGSNRKKLNHVLDSYGYVVINYFNLLNIIE